MIDSGSFGEIFKVPSIAGSGFYATKNIRYRGEVHRNADIVRELYCLSVLEHRNVIKMYEVYVDEGLYGRNTISILMDYAENGSLKRYLTTAMAPRFLELHSIYSQTLSGIAYCHSMEIAHRDISPANVLITKDMVVKIADFGLAMKCTDHQGLPLLCSDYLGTASYMSPEVLSQTPFLPKPADIWSLGILLCYVLFKDVPYKGLDVDIRKAQESEMWRQFVPSKPQECGDISRSQIYELLCLALHREPNLRHSIESLISRWDSWLPGVYTTA